MLMMLILMALAWFQEKHLSVKYKEFYCALGFTLFNVIFTQNIIIIAIILAYAWGYFKVLNFVSHQVMLWCIVSVIGAILPFMLI